MNDQQQNQHRRPQPDHGVQIKARGEQNEQAGDQENAEVFLEVQNIAHIHAFHVGHPHAHQRDSQQAGFMHDLIGGNEHGQHCRQRAKALQVFGQPLLAQHMPRDPAAHDPEQAAAHNHTAKGQQAVAQTIARSTGNDEAVNDHGEQGANRVNDDPFPAQNVRNRRLGPHHAQHRHNDRRPGDQRQGAEQQCQEPVKTQ